jgi:hypothetical protein
MLRRRSIPRYGIMYVPRSDPHCPSRPRACPRQRVAKHTNRSIDHLWSKRASLGQRLSGQIVCVTPSAQKVTAIGNEKPPSVNPAAPMARVRRSRRPASGVRFQLKMGREMLEQRCAARSPRDSARIQGHRRERGQLPTQCPINLLNSTKVHRYKPVAYRRRATYTFRVT